MPPVDAVTQLLYTMADSALMPFSRYISVPQACRQLDGPRVSKPFRAINQFRPEVGDIEDILPSHQLPDVPKMQGSNVSLPMRYFKGFRFSLDDKDYSELSRLGSMAQPAVLSETAEQLALYINLSIFNDAIDQGIVWQRTDASSFSDEAAFGNNYTNGSFKTLLNNHAPMNMHFIANSDDYTNLLNLGKISDADRRGQSDTNRSGVIGTYHGTQFLPQPGIVERNNEHWSASQTPGINNAAGYAIGDSTLAVDGFVPAVGNLFTLTSTEDVYTITDVRGVSGTESTISIFPALKEAVTDNQALTEYVTTPSLHVAQRSIAFASGIIQPSEPAGLAGSDGVRYAVRREPRSGVNIMIYRHVGYLQTIYTMCAWWGSVVDQTDGVVAVG